MTQQAARRTGVNKKGQRTTLELANGVEGEEWNPPTPLPGLAPATPAPREIFESYLLTLIFGLFLFLSLLARYAKDGIVENEEFRIFIYGWLLILPLSIAAICAVRFLKARFFGNFPAFYPALLTVNMLGLLLAVAVLFRLTGQTGSPIRIPVSYDHNKLASGALTWIVFAGACVETLTFAVLFGARKRLKNGDGGNATSDSIVNGFWPLAAFIFAGFFFYGGVSGQTEFLLAAALGLACAFIRLPSLKGATKTTHILDCIAGIAIASLVFDTQMHNNPDDYEFFLGPVADILGGRSLLAETTSQYGVGLFYFLAAVFKIGMIPRTFTALSALISLLYALEYLMLYALLRSLTRSFWLSSAGMLSIILLNNYSTIGYASASPSIGPLRFGLSFLLVAASLARLRLPRFEWFWYVLEGLVLGAASIWSLDTMIYTVVPYAAIVVYEAAARRERHGRHVRACLGRLGIAAACIVLAHGILACATHARSGQWPHWDYYFDYIRLYTEQGFGTLLVNPWTPWAFLPLIYFASLLALAFRLNFFRETPYADGPVVAGLSAAGVSQFIYFVGRSHTNNLYHVCVPAVCLACYWLSWLALDRKALVPAGVRQGCAFIFAFGAILAVFNGWPEIADKFPQSLLGIACSAARHPDKAHFSAFPGLATRIKDDTGRDNFTRDAARMIEKYYKNERRVPLLLYPPSTVWALFYTGKINTFAFCAPDQDEIEPNTLRRILDAPLGLKSGDILIVWNDDAQLGKLTLTLLNRVREQFNLTLVESPLPPIAAFRLTNKRGISGTLSFAVSGSGAADSSPRTGPPGPMAASQSRKP